jgi:predicted metal-dependent phosphoesterase TrpH
VILDLHCHTRWSFDGTMAPDRLVRAARARGLDGVAVTDHGEIGGAEEARRAAGGDLLVIVGQEIETRSGELLGLFLRERIETDDPIEAIRAIHDQGGVAVLPHPFARTLSIEEAAARELDACEGFNARHAEVPFLEGPEGEARVMPFARRYDLSLTAGSDAHFAREIGRGRTIVPASTLEEARDQILRGNTVLSGRRSGALNRLASVVLRSLRRLAHPEPDRI